MTEGNTTHELIGVPTPEGIKTIHPVILEAKLNEAIEILEAEAEQKAAFKELVEELEESTEIPKAFLSKWFKARFKAKTKEASLLGDAFDAMDDAVPEKQNA